MDNFLREQSESKLQNDASKFEAEAETASRKLLLDASEDLLQDKNIVKRDARSAKYCPDLKDGEVCKMTQEDAARFCKEQGGHLPSTREFAMAMNPQAILEHDYVEKELNGVAPPGFYKVASQDENGKIDSFYFNNDLLTRKLTGELSKLSFWTSSIVLGKPDYAHVFYGPLGGGGGTPEDHERSVKHAVLFIGDKSK
ncbi:MAG: hypothetical protein K2X77_12210 [Candidatus Obscuribacterales bacterium]|nr:hypothetical protein [Candidatus Obscuribacterales bacterium]